MINPATWSDFLGRGRTLGPEGPIHAAWRRGRPRYCAWAVGLEIRAVDERLARARDVLGDRLATPYGRGAHITLSAAGFPADVAHHDDDVTPTMLDAQERRLRDLRLPAFTVRIGGACSFASAPFLEVADPGGCLAAARAALTAGSPDFRDAAYVPHVTIGIYAGSHPTAPIARLLESVPTDPISATVAAIGLWSYDAAVLGGPLRLERAVTLGG